MLNGTQLDELRSQLNAEDSPSKIPPNLDNLIDMNLLQKMLTLEDLNFLGPMLPEQTARDIAHGVIDPISLKPYLSRTGFTGKKPAISEVSIDTTPKLQHKPKSLESNNMLDKVSGEKYFKIMRKVGNNAIFPAKKAQSQLSISNFFCVNGQKSNTQLSQGMSSYSLGKKFMEDFASNTNENSHSNSQFHNSKSLKAPYRAPKTMMKSLSLDLDCTASRECSNTGMVSSAKENIPEVIMEIQDEKPFDTFGSPFGFLKGLEKKRRYVSRRDLLDEAEKENEPDAIQGHPLLKKSKTSAESRFQRSKTSENSIIAIGNFQNKLCDLSSFAFKRQNNNLPMNGDERQSIKVLNSDEQDGSGKASHVVPIENDIRIQTTTQYKFFTSEEYPSNVLQKEDQDPSFTGKRLNRQFSEGSESTKATVTQKFRELVEMNIEFEHEEHNITEVDKKLQRLELLFDYKGPVLDFKQVLASTV